MTQRELIENMEQMVKYLLPENLREDRDIVNNYTETLVMIAQEYHEEQLKKICE